jgi:uncharacterized protein (DUF433 family)
MHVANPTERVPLVTDQDGTIRVGGTRVTLDTVVMAFDAGSTPEQIRQSFPTLDLADLYAVIAYVLRHRDEVDAYLARRREEAAALRREIEATPANQRLRERLRAARDTV